MFSFLCTHDKDNISTGFRNGEFGDVQSRITRLHHPFHGRELSCLGGFSLREEYVSLECRNERKQGRRAYHDECLLWGAPVMLASAVWRGTIRVDFRA
jgi:hypothetical protein